MRKIILLFLSAWASAQFVVWGPTPTEVCASGCPYSNLQIAISDAIAGGIIRLRAGEVFQTTTHFILDNDISGDYVTIESSRVEDLPSGYRVFPTQAPSMAKVCTTSIAPAESVFDTERGTHHWRLVGLELAQCASGQNHRFNVITLGNAVFGDINSEPQEDQTSHHFIIDRCYIHGYPFDPGPQRGTYILANDVTITNSYISEVHYSSGGTESHGIAIGGAGHNVLVNNNYIDAGSEGSFTGGGRDQINNRNPQDVIFTQNYYIHTGENITYNYEADPEGNTLPNPATARLGQTFLDLDGADDILGGGGAADDQTLNIRSSTGVWRKVERPLGVNEKIYFINSLWRNQATGTIWKANSTGTRYVIGASDIMMPIYARTVTAVTTGNPTILTIGAYNCIDWFEVTCASTGFGLSASFASGTGSWATLNSQKLHYTWVSSTQISIPFDSTGFGAGFATLTATPQFRWWPQKNGAEFKTGIGLRFEGNIIQNTFPVTFTNQLGYCFIYNLVMNQDGPNATMQESYFGNNKCIDTVGGMSFGTIQNEFTVTSGNITTGTTTRLSGLGSFFGRIGEQWYISGGSGDFAGLSNITAVTLTDTQVSQGGTLGSGQAAVSYNSVGKSTSGVTLRFRDDYHNKPNRWPGMFTIDNNLFEIATPPTLQSFGGYQGSSDSGAAAYFTKIGSAFAGFQFSNYTSRNTIIRRSLGATIWPNVTVESFRMQIHGNASGSVPFDVVAPMDITMVDNLDDGGSGRFTSVNNLGEACNSAVTTYWAAPGSRVRMAGNIASFAGIWQTGNNAISNSIYNNQTCIDGWTRVWGREDSTFPTTELDNSVTVSSNLATFGWSGAARLLPNSKFCVIDSTPNNLEGCYTVPQGQGIIETSTSWPNVSVPGVPDGVYTLVAPISSAMRFQDYNNRDYRLASTSPLFTSGRDSAPPGYDKSVNDWSTETTISGAPNPYLTTGILSVVPSDTSAVITFKAYDTTAATITVSTNRTYAVDLGSDTPTQSGRRGSITVTGLTASTRYLVRLNTASRYKDTYPNGRIVEFTTRANAISEREYMTTLSTDITRMHGTAGFPASPVKLGCHLVFAQGNGFYADNPSTYGSLTLWQSYVDNLVNADCDNIAINADLYDWIANDSTGITRYTDLFTYIVTTKGKTLELNPQATARAKTAIQALPACPNGNNPCYDGTFDSPGDWFSGAKGAMAALAQLASGARPARIIVVHEPTSANSILGISGSAAQWDTQVGNFINDATYGIGVVQPSIEAGAGCHRGEASYCALFSDRSGVEIIGLDLYEASSTALTSALAIAADAIAADGTPKLFYIEETAWTTYTNDGSQAEATAIQGYGWPRPHEVLLPQRWMNAVINRFTAAGATGGINLFWTQPLRYLAPLGSANNGLSLTYNSAVAATAATNLTPFAIHLRDYPHLQ